MKCPIDGTQLVMTDRNGVEIDYCPQCRGVWLDRGELDKIVDRSGAGAMAQDTRGPARRHDDFDDDDDDYRFRGHDGRYRDGDDRYRDEDDDRFGQHGGRRRRKSSFLGDLFDF